MSQTDRSYEFPQSKVGRKRGEYSTQVEFVLSDRGAGVARGHSEEALYISESGSGSFLIKTSFSIGCVCNFQIIGIINLSCKTSDVMSRGSEMLRFPSPKR
jgi:hypothetical protein